MYCVFLLFSLGSSMESTSYVLSFRMMYFYLVTTGWMFFISLCENSIKEGQCRYDYVHTVSIFKNTKKSYCIIFLKTRQSYTIRARLTTHITCKLYQCTSAQRVNSHFYGET